MKTESHGGLFILMRMDLGMRRIGLDTKATQLDAKLSKLAVNILGKITIGMTNEKRISNAGIR